jgi:DNA polymerase III delta prime subunit
MIQSIKTVFSERPLVHHAYGIETHTINLSDIRDCFQNEYSYIFQQYYETFKIDDVRAIRSLQGEKTEQGSVFIIGFNKITTEAENALLKALEEPASNTFFILVFPFAKNLLPTLRSRLMIHAVEHSEPRENSSNPFGTFESFLGLSLKDRFDQIKEISKSKELEITKSHVIELLNQAEHYFAVSGQKSKKQIREILFLKKSISTSASASPKMILDHLAMIS